MGLHLSGIVAGISVLPATLTILLRHRLPLPLTLVLRHVSLVGFAVALATTDQFASQSTQLLGKVCKKLAQTRQRWLPAQTNLDIQSATLIMASHTYHALLLQACKGRHHQSSPECCYACMLTVYFGCCFRQWVETFHIGICCFSGLIMWD